MKIAIYGGSFNPAHIGHQLVAALVLSSEDVDELWFTPTYQHMGGKELISFDHRVEMVHLMARMFGNRASVCRAEQRMAREPGVRGSYTVDLVKYLKAEWPTREFRLIIGSDLIEPAKSWGGWEEIEALAPPIVVPRAGYTTYKQNGQREVIIPDVSSTAVKWAYQRGEDISKLVCRDVLAYMNEHNLYR